MKENRVNKTFSCDWGQVGPFKKHFWPHYWPPNYKKLQKLWTLLHATMEHKPSLDGPKDIWTWINDTIRFVFGHEKRISLWCLLTCKVPTQGLRYMANLLWIHGYSLNRKETALVSATASLFFLMIQEPSHHIYLFSMLFFKVLSLKDFTSEEIIAVACSRKRSRQGPPC